MKNFSFVFKDRDFSDVLMPRLDYRVRSYSWDVLGGPKRANIEVFGEEKSLWQLLDRLRAPVEIYNEQNVPVWWGYIHAMTVYVGGVKFGLSMESMANKLAVAYTTDNVRYTTDWSPDTVSAAEYGTKEMLISRAEISETNALQLRDTQLQGLKYPIPILDKFGGGVSSVEIDCRSWLDTLDWRYYENLAGKESFETLDGADREIGEDDRPICAQSFQISSTVAWDAKAIWLRIFKYPAASNMTDNLVIKLYSSTVGGGGGSPNAELATSSLAGNSVPDRATWTKFTLSASVTLQPSTEYWIRANRSGAISLTKYYEVDMNAAGGYEKGLMKLYNTNTGKWAQEFHHGYQGDVNFIVEGDLATTAQISTMMTAVGEFITATDIVNASGIETNPYRNGDNTALFELFKLLATGTSNDRRLLAEVTQQRRLRVYEEPAKPSVMEDIYHLDRLGKLYDKYGREVTNSTCPVGLWCSLHGVVPMNVDMSLIANPSPFFIEEAEYDVARDRYKVVRTRDQMEAIGGGIGEG